MAHPGKMSASVITGRRMAGSLGRATPAAPQVQEVFFSGHILCESAWNNDPPIAVIGIEN
jgi:hypothetical protein